MDEPHSYCVGCGKSFFLTDKNNKGVVGSSEFETWCHKGCCGKSEACKMCEVYQQKQTMTFNNAVKNVINILLVAISSLEDEQLQSLKNIHLDLSGFVETELAKRSGIIEAYDLKFTNGDILVRIQESKDD